MHLGWGEGVKENGDGVNDDGKALKGNEKALCGDWEAIRITEGMEGHGEAPHMCKIAMVRR